MTRTKRIGALAGLISALAASGTAHAQLPAGVTEMATVEGITEYQLDNGLRFLLFPDQSKQQITVNVTYLVGSRHEAYGETGMAHLLEHLVFKGTPNHPDIPQELTEHGAFPNGTTWFDRTNYYETLPAADENVDENLAWALDLEADRMVNSFIAREDLDSEMTVVRNEWESGENSPRGVLQKRVLSAAYDWHNYGNSTIGARADLENVPIDRLQAFYRKYYQPDNAVLVVAGRFETNRALELIAEKFGSIPRPDRTGANQLFTTYTAEPAQDGERTVTLRRVGDVQLAMAAYHMPPGSHEQFAAVDVMTHLLATRPAGRLYQALVESGLAANAFAFNYQLSEPGVLLAAVEVREGDSLEQATETLLATIQGLVTEPPTEEEVERAKTDYLSSIELAFNNPQGIALQLSEWASMGDWRLFFLHRDRLERVTPEAVHQVAQAYLKPSNRTIGYFYPAAETPARAEIPAAPDVGALVASYTGREAVAEGEAFDPTIENIEVRTERFELPVGLKVAFLPKQNRGEAVTVRLTLRHGTESALMGKATAASFAGGMLMRGTTSRTRQEISDELDRLKAQGGLGGSALTATASFTTVRENLPAVLRLGAEILREPAFDADEFELLREERLAQIESQMSEPMALVPQALSRHLERYPPDHPRYSPTFDEQIERYKGVTVDEARAFWEGFYGAQGGTLAIVGDFDPGEIRSLIEGLLGGWEAAEPYSRVAEGYRDVDPVNIDIETPDKSNAMMMATVAVRMRDDHPDYPALILGNYILGGGMNSRLFSRIRGEEGLSYGVASQYAAPPIDDDAAFLVYAIFAPENADKVVASFRDELERTLADGFTEEELEIARRGYLGQQQSSRANDGAIANMLANSLFLDRPLTFTAEQEAAIEGLTAADIVAAMRRHIDPAKLTVIRGGDFANKLVP
ncbi:M16 family metallopeptidase [Candidatus Palauibacter sp.]|uniref:M16 family metallopeptidase n=1 Tax=Candidatus Palauibacter sp. TaxID=3101350 RepID=UPI003C6F4B6A